MERTNLQLPRPKVFAAPSRRPETIYGQLLLKSPRTVFSYQYESRDCSSGILGASFETAP